MKRRMTMNRQQIDITFMDGTFERHTIGGLVQGAKLAEGVLGLFLKTGNEVAVHIGSFPTHNIRKWVIWDV
jgi:hypothetical protein